MSALLERIVARSSADTMRQIEVPEWGENGSPFIIHYKMVTLAELEQVRRTFPENAMRQNVEIICMKALDDAGKPHFARIDAVALMDSVDASLLLRISTQMMTPPSMADALKN